MICGNSELVNSVPGGAGELVNSGGPGALGAGELDSGWAGPGGGSL